MSDPIDRRAFLKLTAAGLLVGNGCASTWAAESPVASPIDLRSTTASSAPTDIASLRELHTDFPLGVMSGDVTTDRAIVWTRFIGRGDLVLALRDTSGAHYLQHDVPIGADGFTSVDVSGLAPHRTYRYAFLVREGGRLVRRGPSGRFRTAPEPDALVPVTFAGTSCTNQFLRPYPALAHAAGRRDLDFFIHAGDHVYVDFSRSLAEIRERYALAWPSWGMKGLHASVGMYATWDDHEVGNNWDPENWSPTMLAAARRAFFEHHPIRREAAQPNRLWRSFRWGRTAEVFVLDSRGERRPSTRDRANATYLSREQMDWLKQGLQHSEARFKFIVNSVPMTSFHGVYDLLRSDRWEGYPTARHEILDHIVRERIEGVWWLTGDFHFGSISRLDRDGPYAGMREVMMGPGRQHVNPFWSWNDGPQFEFLTPVNNYVTFRCDPVRDTMEVTFVGPEGETLTSRVF